MGGGCVVKGCDNRDTKDKKEHGISYHRFPNDLVRKEHWSRILRIQRNEPGFVPRKNTRICSAHFLDQDVIFTKTGLRKLSESAIPQLEVYEIASSSRSSTPVDVSLLGNIEVEINDLNTIFDSSLKKRIEHLEKHQTVQAHKIRTLQKQNYRLKSRNKSLMDFIKKIKQKNYSNKEIESVLKINAGTAE